jgi:hypothetical protein
MYFNRDAVTLLNLSQACSRFHKIVKKENLWKELCKAFNEKKFSEFLENLKSSHGSNLQAKGKNGVQKEWKSWPL